MLNEARKRFAPLALPLWTLLVAVLAATSTFLLGHFYITYPPNHPFNSDDLLCSDLCEDLLHGRSLSGWHLPCAPYLFPDLPLLAPCHLLAPNIAIEFLAYCLVFHLCLLAILAWLGRLSGLGWSKALTAAGCGTVLLAILHLNAESGDRAALLVHPGSHVGAILVGLFLLALTAHALRYGQSSIGGIVFVLAGGLGTFSDKLVVVQLLAPVALALIVLTAYRLIAVKQAAGQGALLGASLLLSLAIKRLLQGLGLHFMDIQQLGVNLLDSKPPFLHLDLGELAPLLGRLYQGIEHQPVLCALVPLHLLAALCLLKVNFPKAADTPGDAALDRRVVLLAALALVLSPLCVLGALWVGGMARHYATYRYTLSCWFLPCLFLPLLLNWLPGRVVRAAGVVVQLSVVLFAVQRAIVLVPRIERRAFEQPYPPVAQALDRLARQRGSLRGLGGYWLARSISWFSRENVAINPLLQMAIPWFHGSNPNRFLPVDGDDLRIPDHQFLLLRSGDGMCPSAGIAALVFGAPREKIVVGPDEIWLYDSLRSSALDRFLRSLLAERLRARRPFVGPISPACLAQPKANRTPAGARGTMALDPEHPLEIRFSAPITGQILDLGANYGNQFDLVFYRGEERLGDLHVPAVPLTGASFERPGIQARLLSLPAPLCEKKWDRVLVNPVAGTGDLCLAHFLVFAEKLPGPPPRPGRFPPRVRLTANDLFPRLSQGGDSSVIPLGGDGTLIYSPEVTLPAGRYRLDYAVKVDDNTSANEVAYLGVLSHMPPRTLAARTLRGGDFIRGGEYVSQIMTFEIAEETDFIIFGLAALGGAPVALDHIDLIAENK